MVCQQFRWLGHLTGLPANATGSLGESAITTVSAMTLPKAKAVEYGKQLREQFTSPSSVMKD
ncbi:MAG: hypothetical protein ACLS6O_01465 [Bifidobacterium sp.]